MCDRVEMPFISYGHTMHEVHTNPYNNFVKYWHNKNHNHISKDLRMYKKWIENAAYNNPYNESVNYNII